MGKKMRWATVASLVLLLVSCSSPIAQGLVETSTPDAKATLIASPPTFEITFDGDKCIVDGPEETMAGEPVLFFCDLSDLSAYHVPVRHYPGQTFADEVK